MPIRDDAREAGARADLALVTFGDRDRDAVQRRDRPVDDAAGARLDQARANATQAERRHAENLAGTRKEQIAQARAVSAGAAALACLDLLVSLGLARENVLVSAKPSMKAISVTGRRPSSR